MQRAEAATGTVPLKEVGRQAALEAERQVIEQVLYHTSWNRKQASKILNGSYKTLLHKIRESGLEGEQGRASSRCSVLLLETEKLRGTHLPYSDISLRWYSFVLVDGFLIDIIFE